jgi:hypothetical protein
VTAGTTAENATGATALVCFRGSGSRLQTGETASGPSASYLASSEVRHRLQGGLVIIGSVQVPAQPGGLGRQRYDVICFYANLRASDGGARRGSRPGRCSLPLPVVFSGPIE